MGQEHILKVSLGLHEQLWVFRNNKTEVLFSFGYPCAGWADEFGGWFRSTSMPDKYITRHVNKYLKRTFCGEPISITAVEPGRIYELIEQSGGALDEDDPPWAFGACAPLDAPA